MNIFRIYIVISIFITNFSRILWHEIFSYIIAFKWFSFQQNIQLASSWFLTPQSCWAQTLYPICINEVDDWCFLVNWCTKWGRHSDVDQYISFDKFILLTMYENKNMNQFMHWIHEGFCHSMVFIYLTSKFSIWNMILH